MILKACSECSPSHLNMTPPFIPLSSIKFTFFHPSFFTFLSLHTDRIISCPLLSFLSCPVLSSPLLCFQPPSLPSSLLSKDCPSSSLLSSLFFYCLPFSLHSRLFTHSPSIRLPLTRQIDGLLVFPAFLVLLSLFAPPLLYSSAAECFKSCLLLLARTLLMYLQASLR